MKEIPDNILLSGVVGSTAYGLARPGSDVDRLAIFALPTIRLHGLLTPDEVITSIVTTKPDATYHEARKFCALAVNGNPTVNELLWLDTYEEINSLGAELVKIRSAFLTAERTRKAYLGYAFDQLKELEARGDGSFSSDTRHRTAKHARHLLRLCWQGLNLYVDGTLPIQVDSPQLFFDFGDRVAEGDIAYAKRVLTEYKDAFDKYESVLAKQADRESIKLWLLRVRATYYPVLSREVSEIGREA